MIKGDFVLACRACQPCIEDVLEEDDIMEEAGEMVPGMGLGL